MTLLTLLGILCIVVGIGFLGLSARYFYLGMSALNAHENIKKGIFKRY